MSSKQQTWLAFIIAVATMAAISWAMFNWHQERELLINQTSVIWEIL